MKTVQQLRHEGNKVRVVHRRWYITNELKPDYLLLSKYELAEFILNNPACPEIFGPESLGGETYIELTTPNNKTVVGLAECSLYDNFNRRLGVTKALGRCVAQL